MKHSIDKFIQIIENPNLNQNDFIKKVISKTTEAYKNYMASNIKSKPQYDVREVKFIYNIFNDETIENSLELMIPPFIIGTDINQYQSIRKRTFNSRLKKLGLPINDKQKSNWSKSNNKMQNIKILDFLFKEEYLFLNHSNNTIISQKIDSLGLKEEEGFTFFQTNIYSFEDKNIFEFVKKSENINILKNISKNMQENQIKILQFPNCLKQNINNHQIMDFEIQNNKVLNKEEKEIIQKLVEKCYHEYYETYYNTILSLKKTGNVMVLIQEEYEKDENIFIEKPFNTTPIGYFKI